MPMPITTTVTSTIMHDRQAVGAQRDAERRRPAAEQVDQRIARCTAQAMAIAATSDRAEPMVSQATRCARRPPSTKPIITPTKGSSTASTSSRPPGVVRSTGTAGGT